MRYFHNELGILKPLTLIPISFSIFQLKNPVISSELLSKNENNIDSPNKYVNICQYTKVYTGNLPDTPSSITGEYRTLTDIYRRFQNNLPIAYTGTSISENDVILINNKYTFIHKVTTPSKISFVTVPNFTNPLELSKTIDKTEDKQIDDSALETHHKDIGSAALSDSVSSQSSMQKKIKR